MTRQVRADGWWSENDGMTWNHPAPDASAPMGPGPGGYNIGTIGPRVVVVPNPIEDLITGIRREYARLQHENGIKSVVVQNQKREIEVLNARLVEYQSRYEEAEAKLEKIKGHL